MSTPENTSKNMELLDEVRDVMRLYKEKIVPLKRLICSAFYLFFK